MTRRAKCVAPRWHRQRDQAMGAARSTADGRNHWLIFAAGSGLAATAIFSRIRSLKQRMTVRCSAVFSQGSPKTRMAAHFSTAI